MTAFKITFATIYFGFLPGQSLIGNCASFFYHCLVFGFTGICIIAAVSWYADGVIREFHRHDNRSTEFRYTFGAALYVGWISGVYVQSILSTANDI